MPTTARRAVSYTVIAASLIAPFEGLATRAYRDTLANDLPTVCYGMTSADRPVHIGDEYTPEQCMEFLIADVPKYKAKIDKLGCVKVRLTQHQWGALIDASYNAGAGAVCKSPMVAAFNSHDPSACDKFSGWYVRSHGRDGFQVRKGLVRRREAERAVCKQEG